jgi:hypothetical protein
VFPSAKTNIHWAVFRVAFYQVFAKKICGWWFGTWLLFVYSVGNVIIPTDELIFFKGVFSEG